MTSILVSCISSIFPSLKCHLFEPSQKMIWTIVGKHHEYWIDLTYSIAVVASENIEKEAV